MTKERNERFMKICQRARELWESAGRPAGKHGEFWLAAMAEVDASAPSSAHIILEPASLLSRAVAAMDDTISQPVKQRSSAGVKMHSSRM